MRLFVFLFFSSLALAQQSATTSAPCSPIASHNTGTITISCTGMSKEQGQNMIAILNKILANQEKLSFQIVDQKLNEILRALNPNVPVKTYFCNGQWKTAGPGASAAMEVVMGGDNAAFEQMIGLVNTQQFQGLLSLCKAQMTEKPEWLTPYLTCGVAYLGIGDKANAAAMLKDFDSRTGPAYDVDGCKQMSDFIRTSLSH